MLIFDFHKIGGKLFSARKRLGLTQMEVAESRPGFLSGLCRH